MAFKYAGMIVACRSHLGIRLATEFKLSQIQASRVSSQAGYDPLNRSHLNENSKSQAVEDGRSNVRDNTTEVVKEGIINVMDTAQAIGENTKDAVDMVWESAKEGADAVKEEIKDNGNARSSEDIEVAGESGIEEEWKKRLHRQP